MMPLYFFNRKKKGNSRMIIIVFFLAYTFAVLSQTVFPNIQIGKLSNNGKIYFDIFYPIYNSSNNFIPFKSITNFINDIIFCQTKDYKMIGEFNILGNIIMFVPMGIFLRILLNKSFGVQKTLIVSSLVSLAIEILQFLVGRCFDVDDIVLNLFGSLLGYMMIGVVVGLLNLIRQKNN